MNLNSNSAGKDAELASELDWLLGSHQFTPAQIAEPLVKDCFPSLYHWMLLCLEDEELAEVSALKTILAAAENAYRYPGDTDAIAWVFRLGALEVRRVWRWEGWKKRLNRWLPWRDKTQAIRNVEAGPERISAQRIALNNLPPDQRLAVYLALGLGWKAGRVALVLDQDGEQTGRLLDQSLQVLIRKSDEDNLPADSGPAQEQIDLLSAVLGSRFAPESDPGFDLAELARQAAAELSRQTRRRSRSLYWKEVLWLAGTAAIIVMVFWAVNLWLPEPESAVDPAVATSSGPLPARTPRATGPAAGPTPDGPIAVYQVQPGDTLVGVASFLGAPVDELRRMNPDSLHGALQAGQSLRVVLRPPGRTILPTPVISGGRLTTPLDFWLTPKDFVDWLIITPARWTTVWLDGMILDYSPPGIIRTPDRVTFQAWFSDPDRSLVIRQSADRSLSRTLTLGEWQYASNLQGGIEISRLDHRANDLLDVRNLVSPGRTFFVQQPDNWRLLRVETLSGRRALVVDWFADGYDPQARAGKAQTGDRSQATHHRLWFDTASGVILRWQELVGEPDHEVLTRELVVNHIQYDQDFSHPDRFSPWALNEQALLEQDSGWLASPEVFTSTLTQPPAGQERLARVPPGADFNPSTARLQIQYLDNQPPNQQQAIVDVFADSAYLGQIVLSDPERTICVRSQDGRQIAYTYDPYGNPDIMGIGWFRLEFPLRLHRQEIPLIPDSLAFSPNGRYLAYFASPLHASPGRLALIDLQTGRIYPLVELIYATSLVWGPDGESLAMIVADPEPEKREVRIFDLTSRTFTYQQKVSVDSILNPGLRGPDWPSDDWPAGDWGMDFPAPEATLQTCLQP